jgi:putative ABC transport system ATP-binding protein
MTTNEPVDEPGGAGGAAPMVQLEGVHKVYMTGRVPVRALVEVDLEISRGEFVAVMGPSGCGKSTLLNLIGAIDRPTQGRVRVAGVDLLGLTDDALSDFRRDRVGFVYQFYNLIPSLTAAENIELPLAFRNAPPAEREARVEHLLEVVGLEDRKDHTPSLLSGGEQQRVAIARALANNPALVLLDEPTGDLDRSTGASILGLLSELNRDQGVTFVLVSHDPTVASAARRRVLMEDGRIVSSGREGTGAAGGARKAWMAGMAGRAGEPGEGGGAGGSR